MIAHDDVRGDCSLVVKPFANRLSLTPHEKYRERCTHCMLSSSSMSLCPLNRFCKYGIQYGRQLIWQLSKIVAFALNVHQTLKTSMLPFRTIRKAFALSSPSWAVFTNETVTDHSAEARRRACSSNCSLSSLTPSSCVVSNNAAVFGSTAAASVPSNTSAISSKL